MKKPYLENSALERSAKQKIESTHKTAPRNATALLWNRAWEATVEGRYQEALYLYDQELPLLVTHEELSLLGNLNNKALLYLLLGELDRSLTVFRQGRELPPPPAVPQPLIGCTLWLRGEREAACEDWAFEIERRRSGVITHSDEAGGVEVPALLWWASAHPGLGGWRTTAEQELQRRGRTQRCRRSHWPGPLVPFLLGEPPENGMPEEQLMERVGETDYPAINFKRHCQAHFYLGASFLARGNASKYREHLGQVLTPLPAGLRELRLFAPEYHLARAELGTVA